MQSLVIAGVNTIENEAVRLRRPKRDSSEEDMNELPQDAELWKPTDVMNLLLDDEEEECERAPTKATDQNGVEFVSDRNPIEYYRLLPRQVPMQRRRTTKPSAYSPVVPLTKVKSVVITAKDEHKELSRDFQT
jgi:hypothetical protein